MAMPIYLRLFDNKGNQIRGSSIKESREDTIEVFAHDHSIHVPTDNHTGEFTGNRAHAPFQIMKPVDRSSVDLYRAVSEGLTLNSAVFEFYHNDPASNKETKYFSVKLTEVKVVKIAAKMHDVKDVAKERYPHLEIVDFRYKDITWMYTKGNLSLTDSWANPQ